MQWSLGFNVVVVLSSLVQTGSSNVPREYGGGEMKGVYTALSFSFKFNGVGMKSLPQTAR
jgi:hypothetical protein